MFLLVFSFFNKKIYGGFVWKYCDQNDIQVCIEYVCNILILKYVFDIIFEYLLYNIDIYFKIIYFYSY